MLLINCLFVFALNALHASDAWDAISFQLDGGVNGRIIIDGRPLHLVTTDVLDYTAKRC